MGSTNIIPEGAGGARTVARRPLPRRLFELDQERWERGQRRRPAELTATTSLGATGACLFSPPWGAGGGGHPLMAHRRLAEALRLSRDPAAGRPRQPLERRRPSAELDPLPAPVPVPVPVRGRRRRRTLSAPRRARLSHDASGIFSLAFAAGGGCVAAGFGNGAVQLADAATGAPGASLLPRSRARQAATALAFHRAQPGLLLAAGADGTLTVYDLLAHRPASSWTEEENEIHALDFCRDGSAFATAGKDRHVRLYDSHTTQLFQVFEPPDFMAGDEFGPLSGHSRRIFALRFHPTELHLFLTGGWDNSVKVWDKRVPKGARSAISGPHICGPGIDVKGDLVLTGSWVPRNALQLWDLRTSRLWQNLPFPGSSAQGEFLYSARFCAEDMVLAGGSGSCGATVIHMDTSQVVGEILLNPNKPVHVVAVAPGGFCVAVAGAGGNLHLAELH